MHTALVVQMVFCIGRNIFEANERLKVIKEKNKLRDFIHCYCRYGFRYRHRVLWDSTETFVRDLLEVKL